MAKPKSKSPATSRAKPGAPESVLALRKKLGLTQEELASLLRMTFVSVNRWENEQSTPSGLGAVLLELLRNAMNVHTPDEVVVRLRAAGHRPVDIVRTLVALETAHG